LLEQVARQTRRTEIAIVAKTELVAQLRTWKSPEKSLNSTRWRDNSENQRGVLPRCDVLPRKKTCDAEEYLPSFTSIDRTFATTPYPVKSMCWKSLVSNPFARKLRVNSPITRGRSQSVARSQLPILPGWPLGVFNAGYGGHIGCLVPAQRFKPIVKLEPFVLSIVVIF